MDDLQLLKVAREIKADYDLVLECARLQRLPVVNFAAGGVATPADASLMMQLGADGVFVGSGIFKSEQPQAMAGAIVQAVHNFDNPQLLVQISKGLGAAMKGLDASMIPEKEALQARGW
jgi:pyridoxal 5'-phosphate synthase pdxS subunit